MEGILDSYMRFLATLTPAYFFELFWFYFVFEFIRYFFLEFIVLNLYKIKSWTQRDKKEDARRRLFLENPLVSILIPGKNEGKHLYKLANSLSEQTYKNIEMIVVDDGSDDETPIIKGRESFCRQLRITFC
jgi:cellulose synthase/poly-beta-1,6-N-acetylglucosamine synthase-like glycosyltransferase